MPIGMTLPFSRATGSLGYFEATESELVAVEQNIKSLLVTNWGERVMHADMGCNLREFLFEQMAGNELKERIADRIISQVGRWMPFVSVDELNVLFPEDGLTEENSMKVVMSFHLQQRPDLSAQFDFVLSP